MGILKIEMTGFLFGAQNPNLRQSARGLEVITAQIVQIREANLRGSAPEDAKKRVSGTKVPDTLFWSGLRGSNPPPRPWQGRALPNELNPHRWCEVFFPSTLYIITHPLSFVNRFFQVFSLFPKKRKMPGNSIVRLFPEHNQWIHSFSVRISTMRSMVSSDTPARRRKALA